MVSRVRGRVRGGLLSNLESFVFTDAVHDRRLALYIIVDGCAGKGAGELAPERVASRKLPLTLRSSVSKRGE
jgi:hypothetical protein